MSRADQANKRSDSLRVRLSPDMMKRLESVAANLGMPPSTVAALAVGSFVVEQERTVFTSSPGRVVERLVRGDEGPGQ